MVWRLSDAPAARSGLVGNTYVCSVRKIAHTGSESPFGGPHAGSAQLDGTRKYPWPRSGAAKAPAFLTVGAPGNVIDAPADTGFGLTFPRSDVGDGESVVIKSSGAGLTAQVGVPGTHSTFFSPTTTAGGFFKVFGETKLNVAELGIVQGGERQGFRNTRRVTLY